MIPQDGRRPAIVITGASNGIGLAMARAAAAKGQSIVLIGRSQERLNAVAQDVRERGSDAFVLNLDLLAANAAGQVKDYLDHNGLVCDVLVNSAGRGMQGLAASQPLGEQLELIDINARLLVELTLTLMPDMVARRGGGVINMGSVAGLVPGPQMAVYFATKSFVSSFSQALHEELRNTGVTVTCVVPGPVETEFLSGRGVKELRVFRYLPSLSPEEVAESAWRGFRKGRRVVVPGIASKAAAFLTWLVPTSRILPAINIVQKRKGDLCPCGSGQPFIRCCGMTRRYRRQHGISPAAAKPEISGSNNAGADGGTRTHMAKAEGF
jgi:short-subunit dehydrogenase